MKINKIGLDEFIQNKEKIKSNQKIHQDGETLQFSHKKLKNLSVTKNESIVAFEKIIGKIKDINLYHQFHANRISSILAGEKTGIVDDLSISVLKEVVGEQNKLSTMNEGTYKELKGLVQQ